MDASSVVSIWSHEGRSTRSDYFIVLLLTSILGVIAGYMVAEGAAIGIFGGIFYLLILWVSLCACIRRMHDVGRSGWWSLVVLLPVANLIFGLYALFAPGQDHDNEFGPRTSKPTPAPALKSEVTQSHLPTGSLVTDTTEVITQGHTQPGIAMQDSMEEFWAQAMHESESRSMKAGLWAKAYVDAAGVERLAKAKYMRLRATQLHVQYLENQNALKLIRAHELLTEHEKQKAQEVEVAALEAKMTEEERAEARLPKGQCPACDAVIPLSSEQCSACSALFTEDGSWKIKPLTHYDAMEHRVIENAGI